jgi:hypothetical protein
MNNALSQRLKRYGSGPALTHLELAGVLGNILDHVHGFEVGSSALDSVRIVATIDVVDGKILVKVDSVPLLDVFGVLLSDFSAC